MKSHGVSVHLVERSGIGYRRAIVRRGSPYRSLGEALSLKDNSLNFVRLVLAISVIVSHVYDQSRAQIAIFHNGKLGSVAVFGFFGISGYLIARSAETHGTLRFLWMRALRIFPGFWVALLMTAFFFGPIVWLVVHPGTPHAGLGHYFSPTRHIFLPTTSPVNYVLSNWWLEMRQIWISGTMRNASMWTLYYEFICYLVLAGLALVGLLRRRLSVVVLTGGIFVAIGAIALVPGWNSHFNVFYNWVPMNILKFLGVFLVGTLLYLYRDSVPDSGWLAIGCSAVAYGSLWLTPSTDRLALCITITQVFIPAMVYPVLWLGAHLPFRRVGTVHDYSYGVYLYGFPVQVFVIALLDQHWPRPVVLVLTLLLTVPFALASWWVVERNALRLKSLSLRRSSASDAEAG